MRDAAASIARALGGHRSGSGYLCHCPVPGHGKGRGDRVPSLGICDSDQRVLVHCFGGCDHRDVLDELRRRGWLREDDCRNAAPHGRHAPDKVSLLGVTEECRNSDRDRRTKSALRIWQDAKDIGGTLAALYLAHRKLVLPPGVSGRVLRFHPRCPFGNARHSALLALYTGIHDNVPRAIHRTALTPDGLKLGRMVLGLKAECAIKITPDEDVTYTLAIGEGLETTLAGMVLGFVPAWAVGDASGINTFPLLCGIETLTVLVDRDISGTGQRAALLCSDRWIAGGAEVRRIVPARLGYDIADVAARRAAP